MQNVDKVRTTGFELAYSGQDGIGGLDLGGSLTFADSKIVENAAFPASVGKWQPRVPRWRSTVYATWRPSDHWAFTAAARYSGQQYSTLDNSDVNGDAYFGASKYFTVDLRVRYQIDPAVVGRLRHRQRSTTSSTGTSTRTRSAPTAPSCASTGSCQRRRGAVNTGDAMNA